MRFYKIEFTPPKAKTYTFTMASAVDRMTLVTSTTFQIKNKLKLELNEKNPYAVRVTFTIQQFSDAGIYTPSVLTIYNPDTSFFTNGDGLVGGSVSIEAGIKRDSLFAKKLGTTESSNDRIFVGTISRVIPSYQGREPSVAFVLSPVEMGTKNAEVREYTIQKGDQLAKVFKTALSDMMPTARVEIDKSAESLTLQNKQTYVLKTDYFNSVIHEAEYLGMKIAVENNVFTIYDAKSALEREYATFEPIAADFLSQPEWQTLSTIQCTFAMRGDLSIGQKIRLPAYMALSTQSLTGDVASLSGVTHKASIIAQGEFTITSIFHQGDSRNVAAESWATTISASNEKNLSSGG